jgi:hypothetical protein
LVVVTAPRSRPRDPHRDRGGVTPGAAAALQRPASRLRLWGADS